MAFRAVVGLVLGTETAANRLSWAAADAAESVEDWHWVCFSDTILGLMPHEWIAGILHIGTETNAPPERPRPDLDAITEWSEA